MGDVVGLMQTQLFKVKVREATEKKVFQKSLKLHIQKTLNCKILPFSFALVVLSHIQPLLTLFG